MRSQYQKALYQLVSVARGQDLPVNLQSVWPLTQPVGMDWSRYYREFEEIQYIAGGGFGKVYKARHKLDGIVYAIKKITIKSKTINRIMSHLSEVKTLASLNHNNIVPYKAAWLEPLLTEPNATQLPDATEDEYSEIQTESMNQSTTSNFNYSRTTKDESSEFIQFEEEKSSQSETTCHSSILSSAVCKFTSNNPTNLSIAESQPHLKLEWATLYIQMALCHTTLREWLDMRNKANSFHEFYKEFQAACFTQTVCVPSIRKSSSNLANNIRSAYVENPIPTNIELVTDIFMQLLHGLNYIHSRGIIHHDVKPSNIFIGLESNGSIIVQLGDFGLACPLQEEHSSNVVGTPTYAAPEQLKGYCNSKVSNLMKSILVTFNYFESFLFTE